MSLITLSDLRKWFLHKQYGSNSNFDDLIPKPPDIGKLTLNSQIKDQYLYLKILVKCVAKRNWYIFLGKSVYLIHKQIDYFFQFSVSIISLSFLSPFLISAGHIVHQNKILHGRRLCKLARKKEIWEWLARKMRFSAPTERFSVETSILEWKLR